MKTVVLTTIFAMALGMAALAQSSTPGDQQSMPQGANPSSQPSTQPQTSPSQTPDMSGSAGQAPDQSKSESNGEKKLKGCIQSEGGNFVLQDKHGKDIPLAGSQDFASHVGHTVTVHGTYAGGSQSGSSAAAGSAPAASGEQFMVSKIDMNSETCKNSKSSGKDKDHDNTNSKPSPYRQ